MSNNKACIRTTPARSSCVPLVKPILLHPIPPADQIGPRFKARSIFQTIRSWCHGCHDNCWLPHGRVQLSWYSRRIPYIGIEKTLNWSFFQLGTHFKYFVIQLNINYSLEIFEELLPFLQVYHHNLIFVISYEKTTFRLSVSVSEPFIDKYSGQLVSEEVKSRGREVGEGSGEVKGKGREQFRLPLDWYPYFARGWVGGWRNWN